MFDFYEQDTFMLDLCLFLPPKCFPDVLKAKPIVQMTKRWYWIGRDPGQQQPSPLLLTYREIGPLLGEEKEKRKGKAQFVD